MSTKQYQFEMTEAEKEFVIFAIKDNTDFLVDKIRHGEMEESEDNHVQQLINNIMANAQAEIDKLKAKIAELTGKQEESPKPAKVTSKSAPFGLKKDGTPAKKRGRPSKKAQNGN